MVHKCRNEWALGYLPKHELLLFRAIKFKLRGYHVDPQTEEVLWDVLGRDIFVLKQHSPGRGFCPWFIRQQL